MRSHSERNNRLEEYVSKFEQSAQDGRDGADDYELVPDCRGDWLLADSDRRREVGRVGTEKSALRCKILKQVADRTNIDRGAIVSSEDREIFARPSASNERCRIAVSRSEAKFFLDTPRRRAYVDRKIFSRAGERSKIHLLRERDFFNWRSCLSGGGVSSAQGKTDALLKKAEGRRQGLNESRLATPSLREDETLGFWRFSADMEEGLKVMYRTHHDQGGRGDGPIVS